jgi:polyisoprenoid-binding protein YceI
MNAFDDGSMSSGRSRSRQALCLAVSAGMLAVGHGEARAQSQASDSVTNQSSAGSQDSVVYHLTADSRFEVKTSKAGLFGFAGHDHVVRARGFNGYVVYFPGRPESSHLEVIILADSLEVLTPPDTAEIRQVTEIMRTQVLRVNENPDIRFTASGGPATNKGMRLQGELTLVGRTRPVPVDADIRIGPDTIRASGTFTVKQTDFGIKPYSGGPGGTVKVGDRLTFTFDAIALRNSLSVSARAETAQHRERR